MGKRLGEAVGRKKIAGRRQTGNPGSGLISTPASELKKNKEGNGRDAGKKDEHGGFGIASERDVGGEATGSEGELEGESAGRCEEMGRDLVVEQMITCDW